MYSRQTGLFYIAVPGNADRPQAGPDGFVVSVDPRPGATFGQVITHTLSLNSCDGGPTGAALGPNHELLLGCGGAPANGEVVVDITNLDAAPTILADGSAGCDEVSYDAGGGHYGGACRTTTSAGKFEVDINDAHTNTFDAAIASSAATGAHSIAADNVNAQFWMAKFGGDCLGGNTACVAVYPQQRYGCHGAVRRYLAIEHSLL